MKVLIPGIAGGIGRKLAMALHEAGHEVAGIDVRRWPEAPSNVDVHQVDIRKRAAEDVFRKMRPDVVVHMATVTSLVVSQGEERYRINLGGTQAVFDFCGVEPEDSERDYLHGRSVLKWKEDPAFGFTLSEAVSELAESYGYRADDLTNASTRLWPMYREFARATYKSRTFLKEIARRMVPKARSLSLRDRS